MERLLKTQLYFQCDLSDFQEAKNFLAHHIAKWASSVINHSGPIPIRALPPFVYNGTEMSVAL